MHFYQSTVDGVFNVHRTISVVVGVAFRGSYWAFVIRCFATQLLAFCWRSMVVLNALTQLNKLATLTLKAIAGNEANLKAGAAIHDVVYLG